MKRRLVLLGRCRARGSCARKRLRWRLRARARNWQASRRLTRCVFIEGTVRPTGELKANIDAIASKIVGIDNLGDLIVETRRRKARAADSREPFDFDKDVEPWLGERAGIFFDSFEGRRSRAKAALVGRSDRPGCGARNSSTSSREVQADGQGRLLRGGRLQGRRAPTTRRSGSSANSSSSAKTKRPSRPPSTPPPATRSATKSRYQSATSGATEGSLADVYVDVGDADRAVRRRNRPPGPPAPAGSGDRSQRSDGPGQRRPRVRPDRNRPQQRPRAARKRPAATPPSCSAACRRTPSPPSRSPASASSCRKRSTASTSPASPVRSRPTSSRAA